MKEGLAQLAVMSIYQDEFGRMWFGTEEGLSMYDGNVTISFKPTNSPKVLSPGNETYPLTGDKNGNLYFISDYSALLRYDFRTERFEKLIPNNIKALLFHDNRLWFGINDSICIWNPKEQSYDFIVKVENFSIQKIFIDSNKQLWIGTKNGLLLKQGKEIQTVIPKEDIYELFEDTQKNIWIATRENGMYKRDKEGRIKKFMHDSHNSNSISSNHIRCFAEDSNGQIWIGTFLGLNVFNPKTGVFKVYSKDVIPGSLVHSSIFSIYKDKQGSLWIGTYYGGVNYFNPVADVFTYYYADTSRTDCISNPFVGHMAEDKDHNLWICTEGGGLNFFDRKKRKFTHFIAGESGNSISHNNLKSICYSPERNKLYIGTHIGGLSIYDISRKKFHNIKTIYPSDTPELADDVINQVGIYKNEFLIFYTRKGLFKMSLDDGKISKLFKKNYTPNSFLIDSKNNIWLGIGSGIIRIYLENENDQTQYSLPGNGIKNYSVIKIFEDNQNRIFFGTRGSGLFEIRKETNSFVKYSAEQNLLQSNYCYDIVQTKKGSLLISGDKGISILSPDKQKLEVIELGIALPISGINYGCGMFVCQDGEIFIGGVDGLTSFHEESLFLSKKKYKLYFSSLSVNNELVHPGPSSKVLKEALPYTEKITLKYNQNNLIFTFTTNNYVSSLETPVYEYKMEGFDEKWILNTDKKISYTNLSPGKYKLSVRQKQNSNMPQVEPIQLEVIVQSPFYATPLSYALYILVFLGIVYTFIRFKHAEILLSTSLEFERKEKERIEELNQEKLQFFSNISHEFRTPLTLIISQIELLLQNNRLAPSLYNKLLKVYKNSYQMRNLISELLDFRKLEQGHTKLKIAERNMVPFIKEIYLSFLEIAKNKNISYHFQTSQESVLCWIDSKQMQKVILNLLSNAFKYTGSNGMIDIILEETTDEVVIKIIDNGIGIKKEELDKIFNHFYQSENEINSSTQTIGSGIGLSLSKNIIELHKGVLQVESKPGYGSIFSVRLKKGKTHFERGEAVFEKENSSVIDMEPILTESYDNGETVEPEMENYILTNEKDASYSILIIEDNEELLQILVSLFLPVYKVCIAKNGKEGLTKAVEIMPDIILSDIMMPEMSGTEMCLRIKSDLNLSHIPVVLLTALTSPEQNLEGFKHGADAYITKPFNSKVLLACCNNIVRNRLIIKQKFSQQENFETSLLADNPMDRDFLRSVEKIIQKNLNNTVFDMNLMAQQLGVSRSSFYAKFKSLTGMTPNDFVLNYKLKLAARWLKEKPQMQIIEIAEQVGFESARYFSRCFKEQFHMPPNEYRKKGNEN